MLTDRVANVASSPSGSWHRPTFTGVVPLMVVADMLRADAPEHDIQRACLQTNPLSLDSIPPLERAS
jgi:hypothetical protein